MTNIVSNGADVPDTISLKTHRAIAAALIDSVMDGHAFLALTGPAGVGKTTVASAACNELIARSVRVLRIGRGDNDSLPLRTIASQLPARSDVGSDDNDIGERLFDALTVRDAPDQKVVLVIDDAELLQQDVLAYLSLMSKLPRGMLPQVLLVGRLEFWSATLHATSSNIAALITARWEMDFLSPDEVRDSVVQVVTSLGLTGADLFAPGGLDAFVRNSNGLPSRIGALLSRLTPAVIDDAAAMLDTDVSTPLDTGMRSLQCEPAYATLEDVRSGPLPAPDGRRDAIDDHSVIDRPPWMRRFTRAAVLAVVLLTAGVVSYWRVSPHADTADVPARPVDAASTGADAVLPDTHDLTASRSVQAEAVLPDEAARSGPYGLPTFAPDTDTKQDGSAAGRPAMSSPVAASEAAVAAPASSAEAATDPTTPPIRSDALMAASTNAMPAIARLQISDASNTKQVAQRDRPSDQASPIQSDAPNQSATGLLGVTITQAALAGTAAVEDAAPPMPSASPAAGPQTDERAAIELVPAGTVPKDPDGAASNPAGVTDTGGAAVPPSDRASSAAPPPAAPVAPETTPAIMSVVSTIPTKPTLTTSPSVANNGARTAPPPSSAALADQAASPGSQANKTRATAPPPIVPPSDTGTAPAPATPAAPRLSEQKPERIVTAPAAGEVAPPAAQAPSPSIPTGSAAIVTRGDQPKSAQSAADAPRYTSPDVTLLLSRGEAMLSLGDISAARLLYERAATLGSARAAIAVGKTFDPAFLATIHASGIPPDAAVAAIWYRKAAALGDSEAADRLARLTAVR